MKARKTTLEQRKQIASALALMLRQCDPRLPDDRRRALLTEAIVGMGKMLAEMGCGADTIIALLDKIDGDVAEILAAIPAGGNA